MDPRSFSLRVRRTHQSPLRESSNPVPSSPSSPISSSWARRGPHLLLPPSSSWRLLGLHLSSDFGASLGTLLFFAVYHFQPVPRGCRFFRPDKNITTMFWWKLLVGVVAFNLVLGDDDVKVRPASHVVPHGQVLSEFRLESGRGAVDKVEVVSSSLRILPKKSARTKRDAGPAENATEPGYTLVSTSQAPRKRFSAKFSSAERRTKRSTGLWRTPREYQFVTRERPNETSRSARLLEPESSASRYYPEERPYYSERRGGADDFRRRSGFGGPHKRIIYYATLPEIVRRPGEWTPPRPIGYPGGYRDNPRDNEIGGPFADSGTRVSSGVIGFSDKHETLKPYPDDLSLPTFTIIDAEPPYNYGGRPAPPPLPPPERYDNRFDHDRHDYDRHDGRYNGYRNNYADPYRGGYYGDRRPLPPPRHPDMMVPLPPQPITIVRKPLDVRPLDPDALDYTTQGPPLSSSPSSTTSSPTSTSTSDPQLSSYERTFKF